MKTQFLLLCLTCSFSFGQNQAAKKDVPSFSLSSTTWEDAGFDRPSIENLLNEINASPQKDFRGIVVIKNNQIAIEAYFNTYWRKTVHDIRSAGKSVTALLLGIALNEGLIEDLEQDLFSLFSKNKNIQVHEDYKKIKLKHVLDMASGLDADTDNYQTRGNVGHWIGLDDWKDYLLNVPFKK